MTMSRDNQEKRCCFFVLSRGFQIPEVTMLIKCFSLQYKNNAHVGLINV